ncbi:MAG: vanadium-dependent haloperoxidase [Hyphomicrobium sp.]
MRTLVTLFVCCTLNLCAAAQTYFHYSHHEKEELKKRESGYTMDNDQLQQWDAVLARVTGGLEHFEAERVTTYLYVAQEEAASLSYDTHGKYIGSLDPVSDAVLRLLVPGYRSPHFLKTDRYSEDLKEIVMAKIKDRVEQEDRSEKEFPVPPNMRTTYTVGREVARWIPWHLENPKSYWPPSPPADGSGRWKKEVKEIKEQQEHMGTAARESIHKWAGQRGPYAGNWVAIANHYLFSEEVPFRTTLATRAALLTGLYDAAIVFFGAKYHYLVERPKIRDNSVHYEVPVPPHPSYPSGHSTEAGVAKAVLDHYLPQNRAEWDRLAEESCLSRIYGGIHYPIDDVAGRKAGKKIGEKAVKGTGNG